MMKNLTVDRATIRHASKYNLPAIGSNIHFNRRSEAEGAQPYKRAHGYETLSPLCKAYKYQATILVPGKSHRTFVKTHGKLELITIQFYVQG